jgi:hypothetical protein
VYQHVVSHNAAHPGPAYVTGRLCSAIKRAHEVVIQLESHANNLQEHANERK